MQASKHQALELLAFIDACPTPYHAVARAAGLLEAEGFHRFDTRERWQVAPGSKGFIVQGGGTLVAFEVGTAPPSEAGFCLFAAHTDSPNLRVKPAGLWSSHGVSHLSVELYGGVLVHTWFDRDLSLAGRLSLKGGRSMLLDLKRPIARSANLAIHLDREVTTRGFVPNPQTHLPPCVLLDPEGKSPGLLALLAAELERSNSKLSEQDILGFDLCLYDTQLGATGGLHEDFLFSSRLDNLASCHACLQALLACKVAARATRVVVLYDHEEVGSQSASGARSRLLETLLARLSEGYDGRGGELSLALARSFLVSVDMAHAVHPHYAERHDAQHRPQLGGGPVIKSNANQAYATDSVGAAVFKEACQSVAAGVQYFTARNDIPCGSTVGPISAARLGLRSVDVGNPMLSMHSCREMAATRDIAPLTAALGAIFAEPPKLDPAA
jgi:aspartyl aminopeptidase